MTNKKIIKYMPLIIFLLDPLIIMWVWNGALAEFFSLPNITYWIGFLFMIFFRTLQRNDKNSGAFLFKAS